MQFADNAGPDPLTESIDAEVYDDQQRMNRSDWRDVHAPLDLCYSDMA